MPSFPVHSASELAAIVVPLSEAGATEIFDALGTSESIYAAVYGKGSDGKDGKWSIAITHYSEFWLVQLEEYHPRKNGKAEIIVRSAE